jgi:hypothetical protein
VKQQYPDIIRAAQLEVITYCHLRAAGHEADLSGILSHLPHGPITWARIEEPGFNRY